MAAVILPVVVGMSGLATEYGFGLMTSVRNQRAADIAAYSGALAYNATASTTSLTSAVNRVASLNGFASSNVTAKLVASPTGDGNQAVLVSVTTTVPRPLSALSGGSPTMPVSASSYAELKANGSACIIALSGTGKGITLSGGTSVSAPGCAVASNNTVTVPCGTTLTTPVVDYGSSTAPSTCTSGSSNIVAPPGKTLTVAHKTTADPLSSNSAVTAAVAHVPTVAAITSPSAPTPIAGVDLNFGYPGKKLTSSFTNDGCTGTFDSSSNTWTFTCPSTTSAYNFGNISVSGGITVNFNATGPATTTYNFSGNINNTGTAMTFGPGNYNIANGLITGGGTKTIFGAGTFNIGPDTTNSCGDNYSICNTGTALTFSGPSTFVLSSGIYNSGGESLKLGQGATTNSYMIGATTGGKALIAGGGATTVFADATSGLFQVNGMLNIAGGGSCTVLPATAQHDINGSVLTGGAVILGAGVYTVNGYVALGANGGGDVTCSGTTVGVSGTGVTMVVSGASTPSSGSCAGQAFCVAAGYSNVTLTAPTSGATSSLVLIGPNPNSMNPSIAGANFTEGASNTTLSGAMYFPIGPISMSGGSSVGNGSGQCLELIGSQVTLSGGAALASTCTNMAGSSASAAIKLVQ